MYKSITLHLLVETVRITFALRLHRVRGSRMSIAYVQNGKKRYNLNNRQFYSSFGKALCGFGNVVFCFFSGDDPVMVPWKCRISPLI